MTTRRNFLSYFGAISIGACAMPMHAMASGWGQQSPPDSDHPPGGGPGSNKDGSKRPGEDEMDEALEMLAPYGASFRGGLSNHGPMTAEALISIGHQDAVIGWVGSYLRRLEERPKASARIEAAQWEEALGKRSRSGDWHVLFSSELAESPWQKVVGRWVPRLAPGTAAAGLHSVIRVGHAVGSLTIKENALRLDELARALAYWAAEFMPLPGEFTEAGKLAPSAAVGQIEALPDEFRQSGGLITTQLGELVGFEPFTKAIDLVDPASGSPDFMAELVATFAGTLFNTTSNSFDFLHAVTGAAAVAEFLPHVEKEHRDVVKAYTWQATAGIFARYSQPGLVAKVDLNATKFDAERMAKLAVESGDEHTIKLTAACQREWLRNPDPRLLAAAMERIQRHG